MKKIGMALSLILLMQAAGALADMELYVAENVLTAPQAQRVARDLSRAAGEPVTLVMEREEQDFGQRMMDGHAPDLAIAEASELSAWARDGMLMALDGCAQTQEMNEAALYACSAEEKLFAVPLLMRERCMAVRVRKIEAAGMGYLLDARAHPVWYPSEVLQLLDEVALADSPGMALWPPKEEDALAIEAFLQGVSGAWFAPEDTHVREIDGGALEDALFWAQDMAFAQLIAVAQSRESALERFIDGETALFIDWTEAETSAYAKEIEAGEILLMPYPSMTGTAMHTGDVIGVCAPAAADEEAAYEARRAAAAISALFRDAKTPAAQAVYGGAVWPDMVQTLEGGATLRYLFCQALTDVLAGEARARTAAGRVLRGIEAAK